MLAAAARFIPAPRTDTLVSLMPGLRMKVPAGYPVARTYAAGLYEPELTRLFFKVIREGMTIVDAGANIGYYTLIAARQTAQGGRVYAFEPDPTNYQCLIANLDANRLSQVTAIEGALSNVSGKAPFARDSRGAEGFLAGGSSSSPNIVVATTTLDEFFASEGWPAVDLMKIDVEGRENDVLQGMIEVSKRNPGLQVIMELNASAMARFGLSPVDIASTLSRLGFEHAAFIETREPAFKLRDGIPSRRGTHNILVSKVGGVAL